MFSRVTRAMFAFGWFAAASPACSTQEKVNRTLDEVYKLAKNLNDGIAAAKAGFAQAPKAPGSARSVTQGRSDAGLPAPTSSGQTATYPSDVDGDGTDEQVTAFEDASTGTIYYSTQIRSCDEEGKCQTFCVTWWEDGTTVTSLSGVCEADEYVRCVEESGAEPMCVSCDSTGCASYEPTEADAGGGGDPSPNESDFGGGGDPSPNEPDFGGGSGGSQVSEPCPSSWLGDGECDEPEGTNQCPEGTDVEDCAGSGGNEPAPSDALTCRGLFECIANCNDDMCGAACEAAASQEAIDQATAYVDCLNLNSGDESACQAELDACQ